MKRVEQTCSHCTGGRVKCRACDGSGKRSWIVSLFPDRREQVVDCSFCNGRGNTQCNWCQGRGFTEKLDFSGEGPGIAHPDHHFPIHSIDPIRQSDPVHRIDPIHPINDPLRQSDPIFRKIERDADHHHSTDKAEGNGVITFLVIAVLIIALVYFAKN